MRSDEFENILLLRMPQHSFIQSLAQTTTTCLHILLFFTGEIVDAADATVEARSKVEKSRHEGLSFCGVRVDTLRDVDGGH